jgi:flagellar basal-body rod protein FlgF
MSKGIYTALSGAMAQNQQLDTIANNIANANTPSFKGDKNTFKEYLTVLEKEPSVIQVPRVPASIESFYDMQGTDKSYVDTTGTFTDFQQGPLKPTGSPLDIGLEGKGFFEVLTPQGVRYTRKGTLSMSAEGRLMTSDGYPVLKKGLPGEDPAGRFIQLDPGQGQPAITSGGNIYQNGNQVAALSLVNFQNTEMLRKVGNSLYANADMQTNPPDLNPNLQVHQGHIEMSNVNIVNEMVNMIATTRNFDSNQRAIKTYDEMDAKLVNEVPKLG